jgi:ribosomal protein S18 acetylase RimI-like enzyme
MDGLILRPFKDDDLEGVVDMWRKVFPNAPAHNQPDQDIRRKLSVQRQLFLVAQLGFEIIGTAMAGYDGHRGWVYYVAVSPQHRRRGVGSMLMQRVEQDLAQMGCPKINLQVRATNQNVIAFYKKLGYDVEERVSMGKRLL